MSELDSPRRLWYVGYLFFGFALGAVCYLRWVEKNEAKASFQWKISFLFTIFSVVIHLSVINTLLLSDYFFPYMTVTILAFVVIILYAGVLWIKVVRHEFTKCPQCNSKMKGRKCPNCDA